MRRRRGGAASAAGDVTAPTVALVAPANGATVSGTTEVTAVASDDVGVAKVEFYLNGTPYRTIVGAPYSFAWDPSSLPRGSYTWSARAWDAAGNSRSSAAATVTMPVYVTMDTAVNGTGAVGTVSLAGLPVAAPYGLNFTVSMPASATLAAAAASGPYAANGLVTTSGGNAIILASSGIASGEIMKVTFSNVPAGAGSGDFSIALTAVFDGGGNLIQ